MNMGSQCCASRYHELNVGRALLCSCVVMLAIAAAGCGGGSDPPSQQRGAAPDIPAGLVANAGDGQVSLSWNASNGASSYNVKRATTANGPYSVVQASLATTTFANTGLTNETTYYYVVSAANQSGESANSSPANAKPTAPIAKRALIVSVTGSGAVKSSGGEIDCGTGCTAQFANGTAVALSATPATGAMFQGWSGDCAGTTPSCTVTMSAARNVTAAFGSTSPTPSGYGPRVTPGIEPEVTLKDAPAGWSTSADDQVVEGLIFRTPPKIMHARVHFKNVKWLTAVGQTYPGGDHWAFDPAITDDPRVVGLVFEHNDFTDAMPAFGSHDPAQPWIVRASIMRGSSDGYGDSAKAGSNVIIEDSSFVNDYPPLPIAHSDGLQCDVRKGSACRRVADRAQSHSGAVSLFGSRTQSHWRRPCAHPGKYDRSHVDLRSVGCDRAPRANRLDRQRRREGSADPELLTHGE